MDRRAWWATIHGVAKMTEVTENTDARAAELQLCAQAQSWTLELSPSVESCGCGLGPSPVRLG